MKLWVKALKKGALEGVHSVWKLLKMSHFPLTFVLLELPSLVTLFDHKLQVFTNLPKWPFLVFLINFCPLVKVARFARNVECDFSCDFQTLRVVQEEKRW